MHFAILAVQVTSHPKSFSKDRYFNDVYLFVNIAMVFLHDV